MTIDRIHVLVEEPSMENVLRSLLPKLVGNLAFEIFRYNGKLDLLDKLPARLRGYARWLPPSWRIVVIVDRDDDECDVLKAKLERISHEAGLVTRTASQGERWAVVNRLAIEELEAWYFGDWAAVRKAYPKVPAGVPRQASYRDPDAIAGYGKPLFASGFFATTNVSGKELVVTTASWIARDRCTSRSFGIALDLDAAGLERVVVGSWNCRIEWNASYGPSARCPRAAGDRDGEGSGLRDERRSRARPRAQQGPRVRTRCGCGE